MLLDVANLTVVFGGLTALSDVSFGVAEGSIHGLIGPNGAGKTTAFNCITRMQRLRAGTIRFGGHDLLRLPPHQVVRLGMARTFQNLAVCPSMTVLENVLLGLHHHSRISWLAYSLAWPTARRSEQAARKTALDLIGTLGLAPFAHRLAGGLPFGLLKRVEIARALAAQPRLLLLDEPAAGLNSAERAALADLVRWIRRDCGITVLMVEHDMSLVMNLCDRVTVLDFGRLIADGTPHQVQGNPDVVAAYLGVAGAEAEEAEQVAGG